MYCTDKWSVSRPSTESLNIKDTPCFCLQGDFYCQNESWHGRGKHFHRTQSASIVGSPGIPATSLSQHLPTRTKVWSLDNFYARVLKFLWLDDPNLDKNPHHSFSKLYNLVDSLLENISFLERRIFLLCKVTVQTCWRITSDDISFALIKMILIHLMVSFTKVGLHQKWFFKPSWFTASKFHV